MTKRSEDRAQRRARRRQACGDTRPLMMILQEERARENEIRPVLVARKTTKLELPDE